MSTLAVRIGLWILVAGEAVTGAWALLAPLGFYEGFPLPGHPWVAMLPPYNEHLLRDFGALNLALVVVLVAAAVRADRSTVRVAAAAYLVFTIPHAIYHSFHLAHFPPADAVGQTVGFAVEIVIGVVVLVLAARLPAQAPVASVR